jgi:hypothetical protein
MVRGRFPDRGDVVGSLLANAASVSRRIPETVFIAAVLFGLLVVGTAALASPRFWRAQRRASYQRVRDTEHALAKYSSDRHRCPATRDDLVANGYLEPRKINDAWTTSLAYWCSEHGVHVLSAGPDRRFNTDDDITSSTFGDEGAQ